MCGANRISFGMQDFDPEVQRRVNRPQPAKLFEDILTEKVRKYYTEIAFDLLIGLPGQTVKTMERTCDKIVDLKPTLVQLSLMAYKPWVAKYQIQMMAEGPLPDFLERKELLNIIHHKLSEGGYLRTGFECYSLPDSPMTKAFEEGTAHYGASGHQTGGRVNFVAVGSSAHGSLGNEYYSQNFYEQNLYRDALDANKFPIHKGIKLDTNDKIRRDVVKTLRTYFEIDFQEFESKFDIDFKHYFKKSFENLKEHLKDGLITIDENKLKITELGFQFSSVICHAFDDRNL